jgi:hypothetical protein
VTAAARTLALIAALVVGLVIGLAGGFVQAHRMIVTFDDRYLVLPWGVVIVVGVLLVAIRGVAKVLQWRAAGWFVLAGWVAMTFFLATETSSGDLAVSGGARQWGYLLGGAVIGAAIATLPARSFASIRAGVADEGRGAGEGRRAEEPSGLV